MHNYSLSELCIHTIVVFVLLYCEIDSREDRPLGTYLRRGVLGVGMSYSQTERVSIPNAIFGNYSIIVVTDLFNAVYEHFDEDDNSGVSTVIK